MLVASTSLPGLAGFEAWPWQGCGAGPAVQGLLGGDVHMMFVDYATARSHIAAGTLKALGVAALTPRSSRSGSLLAQRA